MDGGGAITVQLVFHVQAIGLISLLADDVIIIRLVKLEDDAIEDFVDVEVAGRHIDRLPAAIAL